MEYPKIIDASGKTLAILNNIINPVIREQINGEYTFSFTAIMEELKTDYIHYNNYIEVNNNIFIIAKYTKKRTQGNKLLVEVLCEQVSYVLIDYPLENFEYTYETPTNMLAYALMDTAFTIGTVTVGGHSSVQITQETNKREVLNHIAQNFRGEFVFDRYTISFLQQRGQNRGVQFRVGKNVKGISKIVDATVRDEQGNPKVTYEVDILELNELEDFKGLEGFSLGDTVRVIDEELGIDVYARIFELEYNPVKRINTTVVLGNFIENLAIEQINIKRASNLVSKRSGVWDRAGHITEQGTFLAELLEGTINTLQNQILAGLGTVTITENNGILITDQPTIEASTKAIRLLGGILAIANKKDANGNFIFRTFGTGDGFVADHIISGTLDASVVRVDNLTFGDLSGRVGSSQLDDNVNNNIQNAANTANTANQTANQAKEIASKTNVNLIKNGGAEICTGKYGADIPDEWTPFNQSGSCTFTRRVNDPSWTISGKVSFEIRAVSGIGAYFQEYHNPKIGVPYTLSAKLGCHRCDARLIMRFTDINRNHLLAIESQVLSDDYIPLDLSITGITPPGTGRIIAELWKYDTYSGQEASGSYLFADNVKLEEGSVATPYIENDLSANDTANTANNALAVANNCVQKGQKFDNSIMIGNGNGIKVLDSSDVARVTLGQYAAGKYGLKVTNGEIFGTKIRSGAEGSASYVEISETGDPFKIVKDGKKVLDVWAESTGGYIQFYNGNGEMRGQISPHKDLHGTGLRIDGRSDSGKTDVSIRGNKLLVDAPTDMYGDVFVVGSIKATVPKNAVVFTDSYGDRLLYCMEMPEVRFMDEGVAYLKNGTCKIDLDPIFLETIENHSKETPYRIHLTPNDWINIRVKEIGANYFVVEEKDGLDGEFTWLFSATRKNYSGVRMARIDDQSVLTDDWEKDLYDEVFENE